jgi:glycosyltransferase involved in cell wall biosynthesis
MTSDKQISIILPNYNDKRIVNAISSVIQFDDVGEVKILVIDGGSDIEVQNLTRAALRGCDVFCSEPDKGIFDALNKGLAMLDTPYAGWLGSDDLFTGRIKASQVIRELESHDLFIADVSFFNAGYVTRKTHAYPCSIGLMKLGLHNPHYATFGRSELLAGERFRLDLHGSDIEYFLRIFNHKPRISTRGEVATYQAEGGYSNRNLLHVLKTNLELVSSFGLLGPIAIAVKLSYKALSKLYYTIHKEKIVVT